MFFWNSLAFLMIQRMLTIWSLVPLSFLNPAWTSGSSWFMYYWSLAWRILSITLLVCEMSSVVWYCGHFWLRKVTNHSVQFSSVQSLSRVWLFATPWTAAHQASLFIPNSQSSPKLKSIKSVMPSSHLILCCPLFLLLPIPPSIRGFSNESTLRMRWPQYWSFSFSIIPSKEIPGLISFRMDWLDLLAIQGTLKNLLQHTVQKHQFFGAQLSSQSNSHIHTWPLEKP